jgi:polysaccharide export outer membrane protein
MNSQRKLGLTTAFLLLLASSLFAQVQTDYSIGIGDLLTIDVLGVQDFSREVRVNAAGNIPMPFIGEIHVQGLTPAKAQETLAARLNPEYVRNPQVSVLIKEPRSRTFSVIGAVQKPDQYQIIQPITLVAALSGAGGLNFQKAGDAALIQRSYENPDSPYQIEVNLKKLLFEGDMSLDLPIMPGDVVNVPVRVDTSVYVIGDVTKPGPFDYPSEKGIYVSRALAMAGGPTKTSKLSSAALVRQLPDGSIERTPVDPGKIMKGKMPDIAMQPNDILYIPGSVGKNFAWAMIQQAPYMLTWAVIP